MAIGGHYLTFGTKFDRFGKVRFWGVPVGLSGQWPGVVYIIPCATAAQASAEAVLVGFETGRKIGSRRHKAQPRPPKASNGK